MNPPATNHPISWFKKFYDAGTIDLTPHFQRRPVWSDSQSSYLIDSILSDLPIPEIFVRTKTKADGDTTLEVVDGQQRLRSIIRFFTGDLELQGDDVSVGWLDLTWKKLSDTQRETFWAYKLVVRELENQSDLEVRDMFRRLNANQSSLNEQELRHSQLHGRFIKLVEALADDSWWLVKRIVTPAQVRRMLDVEYVSELLVAIMSGPLDKKEGLEKFYEDYDDEFPEEDEWRQAFTDTRELTMKVGGEDLTGWRSKTEYYSLFLGCGRVIADDKKLAGAKLAAATARLKTFRARVDQAKKKDNTKQFPKYVHDYADAVARASTDLGRRLYRIAVVEALIKDMVPPTWATAQTAQ